jgi:mono/diheme cytochrome c family protein
MSRRAGVPAAGVAVLVALGLVGCDSLPGRPDPAHREVAPAQVMAFDELYDRNCAGCHGAGGRLGAARPLHDPVYLALIPHEQLRTIVSNGVSGTSMPAFGASAGGGLTDAQIGALLEGMLARWGRPDLVKGLALPSYEGPAPGSSAAAGDRGAAVYASACARCHGPGGRGGPEAGSIVDPSFLALVSDQSLRTTVIAGRADLGKPDWRENIPGRPLTPQQISDVVVWLVGHRRPVPGRPASSSDPRGSRP